MNINVLEVAKYIAFTLMITSSLCGVVAHFLMVNYLNSHMPPDKDKLYSLLMGDVRVMWKYYDQTKVNEGKVGYAFWFHLITILSFFVFMIIYAYFTGKAGR